MENNQNDYHVSFFKPVTEKARKNRNMIIWLVLIWGTAVFGFQILLRVIEKPVPEAAYENYMAVWPKIESGEANQSDKKIFANSVLTVLGKVYVKADMREALSNAFTWAVYQVAEDEKDALMLLLSQFEQKQEEAVDILDATYLDTKKQLENEVASLLGISAVDAKRMAIPFTLNSALIDDFTIENRQITSAAMPFYLIHNRSILTDAKFLGFPFHYFYTAVFLLILFIGLCWIYCIITDRRELKEQTV